MKKVKAFIERGEDGSYGIFIDLDDKSLNYGISGEGNSVEEALEDFRTSYEEMKAYHQEIGKNFVEAEFEYLYDMASFLGYYNKYLSLAGLERLTGIAQGQLSHYLNGKRKPSKKTVAQIQNKLHRFGSELQHLEFA